MPEAPASAGEDGEAWAGRSLPPEILRLRHLGARGGRIRLHRALATLDTTWIGAGAGIAVGAALSLAVVLLLQPITAVWTGIFIFWFRALGLAGAVTTAPVRWGPALTFELPALALPAATPGRTLLWGMAAVLLLLLFLSIPLARRTLPIAYLLRTLVLVQGTSVAYFGLFHRPLLYGVEAYTRTMMVAGLGLMVITPFLLGLTYNVYNVGVHRKLVLVALVEMYLLFLLPHQYLLHAVIVHYGTLVFLPLLYFGFGVLLDVVALVGWYAWALRWPERVPAEGSPEERSTTPWPEREPERIA